MVAVGLTLAVPCGRAHGLHTVLPDASVIEREVAVPFETCHARVADCPAAIVFDKAVKLRVKGTVTLTVCGPAVPPGPVAVSENVVVVLKEVSVDPDVGRPFESSGTGTAGVMVTAVALVVAHVKVVVCPPPIVVGVAENFVICGGAGGGAGCTCTVAVCEELLPPAPVAKAE